MFAYANTTDTYHEPHFVCWSFEYFLATASPMILYQDIRLATPGVLKISPLGPACLWR